MLENDRVTMQIYRQFSNFRSSFQFKLLFVFSLITFLIACLLTSLYIVSEIKDERYHATELLQLRTVQLADSIRIPLYAENREMLHQLAEPVAQLSDIHRVVIASAPGQVLVDINSSGKEQGISDSDTIIQTAEVRSYPLVGSVESALNDSVELSTVFLGTVRLERGTSDLSRIFRNMIALSVSVAVVFWLAVSLFGYLVLRRVTRSFTALMSGIETLQMGDFTSRTTVACDDEPGRATHAINELACVLQQRGQAIDRLHEERLLIERQMQQTQKLESLGVMAGGIAHDYNNLLQAILGNIELASRELDPESPPQKYITNAILSGKHAAHLTSLMLTYVGKGFIAKKEIHLNELLRENSEMLRTAASTAVTVELRFSAELPPIIADEAQIQQVIMNLVINAGESIVAQLGVVRVTTGVQEYDKANGKI